MRSGTHPLPVRVEDVRPGIPLLVPTSGSLSGHAVGELGAAADAALGRRPWGIVVDLSGIAAMTPAGLAMLVRVAQRAGDLDVGFCIVESDAVRSAVARAGLQQLFELHPGVEEALAALRVAD